MSHFIEGEYGDEKVVSITPLHALGLRMVLPDGRAFRYCSAGEDLPAGETTMQAAGIAADDMDLVVAVDTAVGLGVIPLTTAGAIAEDTYAGGYLYINDADGEGHIYRIASHSAAVSGSTLEVVLATGEVVAEALTNSGSLAGLMKNPYTGVEVFDRDDVDGPCLGVAATEIAASRYGWLQTWGYAAVHVEGGVAEPVLGQSASQGAAVDGSLELNAAVTTPVLGVGALIEALTGDYAMIKLMIDP